MTLTEKQVAVQAREAVRSLLRAIPSLELVRIETPRAKSATNPDLVASVKGPRGTWRLVFEVKASGQPRLATQAVNQLLQFLGRYRKAYGVFVAPYVSPAAAEVCTAHDVGFLDLSGNCRLSFGTVFVEREGRPNRFAARRDLRTLYSPKASRVLRVLLSAPRGPWKVADLAREAEVSLGLVSNVKRLLGDREWIGEAKTGFTLGEPKKLLAEWSDNYTFRRNVASDYYTPMAPSELEASLAAVCSGGGARCALTAFSAAARMAPAVRYQRVYAYVEGPAGAIARELGLKEVTSGPNVTFLDPFDSGVFYGVRQIDGACVVSPVQAYLDLLGLKGRGEEAAQKILDEVIVPQW
ncbi:MAG: hypothetical protein JW889_00275 [Verrucomicrobia bacterium]|nr:hypothetical protein [Verrucomicrobiota bacterium]